MILQKMRDTFKATGLKKLMHPALMRIKLGPSSSITLSVEIPWNLKLLLSKCNCVFLDHFSERTQLKQAEDLKNQTMKTLRLIL
jgi:hypothetical protein